MATLTKEEVFAILDKQIKKEMELKNEYIAKNGFKNIAAIRSFDSAIATLTGMYYTFTRVYFEKENADHENS